MAYCKAAKRECVYLDDIKDTIDDLTLARATDNEEFFLSIKDQAQTAHERTLRQAQLKCVGKKCGLLALAVEHAYSNLYSQNDPPLIEFES